MRVEIVYAAPGVELLVTLVLEPGATVADAMAASRFFERPELDRVTVDYAIFGQRAHLATPLRDGDRVELVRPLELDAKEARRRRATENPLPPPHRLPKSR